jgi:hypothetical protein
MTLVGIVVALIIVGLVLWLINTYIPMAGAIKSLRGRCFCPASLCARRWRGRLNGGRREHFGQPYGESRYE